MYCTYIFALLLYNNSKSKVEVPAEPSILLSGQSDALFCKFLSVFVLRA